MRPPDARSPAEWRQYHAERLGAWWAQWESSLRRHDDLGATVAAGDNCAFFAKQMGLGRSRWLAEALAAADSCSRVLVRLPSNACGASSCLKPGSRRSGSRR